MILSEMKAARNKLFAHAGFFVLRTPLLPFDELLRWSECQNFDSSGLTTQPIELNEHVWRSETAKARAFLMTLMDLPTIRQALYFASPSLEKSIEGWKCDPEGKKGSQTERALARYFARMAARATPFGLFSGHTVGTLTTSPNSHDVISDVTICAQAQYIVKCRLDCGCLFDIGTRFQQLPEASRELQFHLNTTLYKSSGNYCYLESHNDPSRPAHTFTKIYSDFHLESVIAYAHRGRTIDELTDILTSPADISPITSNEAYSYISTLISSQVLISDLSPAITADNPMEHLLHALDTINSGAHYANLLREIQTDLTALSSNGLAIVPDQYRSIVSRLEPICGKGVSDQPLQADLVKPAKVAHLSDEIAYTLLDAVEWLNAIGANPRNEGRRLQRFRKLFSARYGRAWIPLTNVLDEETGITLDDEINVASSALLRGFPWNTEMRRDESLDEFHATLLTLVTDCLAGGSEELVLDAATFPVPKAKQYDLPDSFSLMGTIVAPSMISVDKGEFAVVLRSGSGPSGATMLGRFCHVDSDLRQKVEKYLAREEHLASDAIFAEVVYLPTGRLGNIAARPAMRDYEIVYLAQSSLPTHRQIPVSDLLVTVSAKGDILLYSQRLRKRIIPRLTSAHTFNSGRWAPVYRFLCYLQYEPWTSVPVFDWGPLNSLPYLPRIRRGKTILSLARWRLDKAEIAAISQPGTGYQQFAALTNLRRSRRLPRWVALVEGDRSFPVDLNNPLAVDSLLHVLRRSKEAILQEVYPGPNDLCIRGPEGRFCHEVIIPFIKQSGPSNSTGEDPSVQRAMDVIRTASTEHAERIYPPGSRWLYAKVYGGAINLDDVLTTVLPGLIEDLARRRLIEKWFFIRYADPERHIRVRFMGDTSTLISIVLPLLTSTFGMLLNEERISRFAFDVYEREIERYGGIEGMNLAEDIFHADSVAVLALLRLVRKQDDEDLRWKLTIMGMDRLLRDAGLSRPECLDVVRSSYDYLAEDLMSSSEAKDSLASKFRAMRSSIEPLLKDLSQTGIVLQNAEQILVRRTKAIESAMTKLRTICDTCRVSVRDLAASYLHMHVNRMVHDEQRRHELILSDFLVKLYRGALARKE